MLVVKRFKRCIQIWWWWQRFGCYISRDTQKPRNELERSFVETFSRVEARAKASSRVAPSIPGGNSLEDDGGWQESEKVGKWHETKRLVQRGSELGLVELLSNRDNSEIWGDLAHTRHADERTAHSQFFERLELAHGSQWTDHCG